MNAALKELWVCHLGVVPYGDGVAMQEHVRDLRLAGEVPDTLLLLEHPPTFTRGRRSGAEDLPWPDERYHARGAEVFDADRGGRVTYHGPGQLVGYPIMAAPDVHRHVRTIESAIVDALSQEGVIAHARVQDGPDFTGVWVGERKIASIGVHIRRGVSTHGFAVNVVNDLDPFSWVLACGLPDVQMTSLERERVQAPADAEACAALLGCFRRRAAHAFAQAHGRRQRLVTPQRLGIAAARQPEAAPA